MKRLYLTVEGQTEQAFAKEVLQPHLIGFGVAVTTPRLTGLHARRKGRIPTGGLLSTFGHTLGDIRRWMKEDRSPDARFSTMIDLYSLPTDFPGYETASGAGDTHRRAQSLEAALAAELGDRRFIPYLQVHEFEALILAAPGCLAQWLDGVDRGVAALRRECEAFATPEHIDQGLHTHPKARIKKHIPDYDANVDGPALAACAGLEAIREKCPHFNEWLTRLEQLDV